MTSGARGGTGPGGSPLRWWTAGLLVAGALLPPPAALAQGTPHEALRAGDTVTVAYWPGDSVRARRTLETIRGFRALPALPDSLPSGVTVYLPPDEVSFDSLTGGMVPEWGAGVAVPDRSTIVLPPYGSPRTRGWSEHRTLRHEWAHIGLHQYLDGLRIPRWLDEGYAEWASGGWDATRGWRLSLAFATGAAPPLDSLTLRWPRDRASADLAYMLSATAVEYLAGESGERGLALFFRRFREDGSFETALRRTFGVTSGQLEEDWQKYVKGRYGWLLFFSNSLVSWAILGLLLALLFWIRRRRDRERMARLRATEPPERPAYWMWGVEPEKVEGGPGGSSPPGKRDHPNHEERER